MIMEQYISKNALVAEIEKLKAYLQIPNAQLEAIQVCDNVIRVINTLEVKEVVDAEIVEFEDNNNSMCAYTHLEICTDEDLSKICKAGDKAKVIIIKQK